MHSLLKATVCNFEQRDFEISDAVFDCDSAVMRDTHVSLVSCLSVNKVVDTGVNNNPIDNPRVIILVA